MNLVALTYAVRERLALKLAPWLLTDAQVHEELQPLADAVYARSVKAVGPASWYLFAPAVWTSRSALIAGAVRRVRSVTVVFTTGEPAGTERGGDDPDDAR